MWQLQCLSVHIPMYRTVSGVYCIPPQYIYPWRELFAVVNQYWLFLTFLRGDSCLRKQIGCLFHCVIELEQILLRHDSILFPSEQVVNILSCKHGNYSIFSADTYVQHTVGLEVRKLVKSYGILLQ